jgi:hypothetical protein
MQNGNFWIALSLLFSCLFLFTSVEIYGVGGKMLEWGRYWQHGKREGFVYIVSQNIIFTKHNSPSLSLSGVKESFSQKLVIMI